MIPHLGQSAQERPEGEDDEAQIVEILAAEHVGQPATTGTTAARMSMYPSSTHMTVMKSACRSDRIVGSAMTTADASIAAIRALIVVTESVIHS